MNEVRHDPAHSGHSRWGADDQLGAGNLLTQERRLAALRSIRTGALWDLSHEISPRAPFLLPNQTPFLQSIWASWRDSIRRRRAAGARNDAGSNVERVEMTMHVGTHIDALGHFSIGGKLYNGLNAGDVVTDWGLDRLGIEHVPPMICRGVLLDVSGLDGGEFLNPGRVVGPDDLARAADAAEVAIGAGDIVLIRTGWGRFFAVNNDRYLQGEPGIDVPAARWLTERDVVAIGCDNMAVEVLPNPDRGLMMPVHQHVLVEAGVHLIENLALDELARERIKSFCFVLLAARFKGATGCPVRPIALV
ncbi:MAG: cyclase family protein [Alphaproteobacteria bacterium]|nr:cyclase family protein [Alphaproteobacteria bacterium]